MKNVVVTGGAGFIGKALVRALLDRGDFVTVLDDFSRSSYSALGKLQTEDFRLMCWNISIVDPKVLTFDWHGKNPFQGADQVIHLAAINGTKNFYERPDQVLGVSIRGMLNVVDLCEKFRPKDLLVASSSEVYAEPSKLPTPEDVPLVIPNVQNPRFSYSGGKIATELMTLHMASTAVERAMIVRPHNVYGPDAGEDHVIPTIMRQFFQGKRTVKIQGSGLETRSFCYIDDCISGMLTVLDKGEHKGIYHVGRSLELNIIELVRSIGLVFNAQPLIEHVDAVPGSPQRRQPDTKKLRDLGWEPKMPLLEGLRLVKEYLQYVR